MKNIFSLLLSVIILSSAFMLNVSGAQIIATELTYDASNENCIKLVDAIKAYEEENEVTIETYRNYFYIPDGTESFFDDENCEVPTWYNEYFTDVCIWYTDDMCENAPAPTGYCGFSINKTEHENVYYADIPVGVEQFVINNGVDKAEPIYSICCSADIAPDEADDGDTLYHDNMIYVLSSFDSASMSSTAYFYGEWYYYYGDGCYGTVENGTVDNCIRDDHFDENEQHKEPDFLYKDKFMELSGYREYDPSNNMQWETFKGYKELYYHQDEQSGETDWVLFYVRVDIFNPTEACFTMSVGNRLIRWWAAGAAEFPYGYGVYDIENDQLYSISTAMYYGYDGLVDAFEELELGYERGDIDRDKEISILDATEIQFYLAKLKEWERDDYSYIPALGDFNEDGEMDILDATAIQRKLAGLDRDPSQYPVATPDQAFPIAPTECDHY